MGVAVDRLLADVALAVVALAVAVAGLATGTLTVPRWIEVVLFGLAAIVSLATVLWCFRPVSVLAGDEGELVVRGWKLLRWALLALALALGVAVVRPDTAQERLDDLRSAHDQQLAMQKEDHEQQVAQSTVKLSPAEIARLKRIEAKLRAQGHPAAANAISAFGGAAAGGIGAGLLTQGLATLREAGPAGISAAGKVLQLIGSRGALRVSSTVRIDHPTLKIDRPTFRLGGLHLHSGGGRPTTTVVNVRKPLVSLRGLHLGGGGGGSTGTVLNLRRPLFSLATLRVRLHYRNVTNEARETLPDTP